MFSSYDFYLQAIFASSIPEIIDLVGSRSKYSGEYKREHGKRYYYQVTSYTILNLLSIKFTFLSVCICIYLLVRINENAVRATYTQTCKHIRCAICTRALAHMSRYITLIIVQSSYDVLH